MPRLINFTGRREYKISRRRNLLRSGGRPAGIEKILVGGISTNTNLEIITSGLKGMSLGEISTLQEGDDRNGKRIIPEFHTNSILEYFGFEDGSERSEVLKRFNGDHHYGAGIIKTAYHLSRYYGLDGRYDKTGWRIQDAFLAIADSIHLNGPMNTDTIIEKIGIQPLRTFVNISRGFSLVDVLGVESFVDSRKIQIESGPEIPVLKSPWAERLKQDRYTPRIINGFPFYGNRG